MQGWEPDSFEKQINAPKSAIYRCPPEASPNFWLGGIKLVAKIQICIYKLAHLSSVTPLTAARETQRGKPAGNRLLPNYRCPGSPIDLAALDILQTPETRQPREPEPPPAALAGGEGMTSLPTAPGAATYSDLATDAVMPRTVGSLCREVETRRSVGGVRDADAAAARRRHLQMAFCAPVQEAAVLSGGGGGRVARLRVPGQHS